MELSGRLPLLRPRCSFLVVFYAHFGFDSAIPCVFRCDSELALTLLHLCRLRFQAGYEFRVTASGDVAVPTVKSAVERLGFGSIGGGVMGGLGETLPTGSAVSVSGDVLVDTTNNFVFSRVSRWTLTGPPSVTNVSYSFPAVSSLVFYDLATNYTWDSQKCNCSGISGTSEMPLLTLPRFAVQIANDTTISQANGQTASRLSVFLANYTYLAFVNPFGNVESLSTAEPLSPVATIISFWVDSSNLTRRVEFSVSTGAPEARNFAIRFDLWDPSPVTANALILPDKSCQGVCQNRQMVVAKPSVNCTAFPNVTVCLTSAQLPFCNSADVLTYPVSTTLYPDEADSVAKTTVDAVVAAVNNVKGPVALSDACQAELKQFTCQFYLPQFSLENRFLKPNISNLACFSGLNDAQRQAAYNAAGMFSVYRTIAGDTASYPSSTGIQGWQIAVIVLTALALVAGVAFGLWQRSQSKREDYQAV